MIVSHSVKAQKVFTLISEYKILLIVSFVLLTAISAHVAIPAQPVPFTMQTLVVLLSGIVLGSKKGAYAQVTYLTLGALGLPVFTSSAGSLYGIMRLAGPTGGYLLAFPLGAYLTGLLYEQRTSIGMSIVALLSGEAVIITFGTLFLNTFYVHNIQKSIILGASLFSIWTLAKVAIGAGAIKAYSKFKK